MIVLTPHETDVLRLLSAEPRLLTGVELRTAGRLARQGLTYNHGMQRYSITREGSVALKGEAA